MTDEEYLALYEDTQLEQESKIASADNLSVADHEDLCTENNHGINNFGLDPNLLLLSKLRYNAGLRIAYSIVRKCMHRLRYYIDRCNNNKIAFRFLISSRVEHFAVINLGTIKYTQGQMVPMSRS